MEYIQLVMAAFQAALSWWTEIVTSNSDLFNFFLALIFASMVVSLFVLPFLGSPAGFLRSESSRAGSAWFKSFFGHKNHSKQSRESRSSDDQKSE